MLLLSCGAAYSGPPQAPPPPPAVDDEFLEFLGSVDSEPIRPEDMWLVDYWSKPAPKPGTRPPPPAAKPAPPAPKPSTPPAGTQNNG